ncbi:MAG: M23 family metallopeptidase [Mariprofundales bacterium]
MACTLKTFIALLVALLLSSCYKTELPSLAYQYGVSPPEIYIVRSGDTLYSIGQRFGIDYHRLIRRNRISKPHTIYVGQRVYLTHLSPKEVRIPIPRPKKNLHSRHRIVTPRTIPSSPKKTKTHKKHPRPSHIAKNGPHTRAKGIGLPRLGWPTKGIVTSKFGRRGSRMHDGIDIGAKTGTAVTAAAAGEVVYADHKLSGYGNLIIIRHSRDLFTAYAHNKRNLVRRGDRIHRQQKIAEVGQTGRATGPHLHFEVRRGTTPVDPLLYLPKKGK